MWRISVKVAFIALCSGSEWLKIRILIYNSV